MLSHVWKCEIEAGAEGQLQACLDFAVCHEASNSFPVAVLKWYKIKSSLLFAFFGAAKVEAASPSFSAKQNTGGT